MRKEWLQIGAGLLLGVAKVASAVYRFRRRQQDHRQADTAFSSPTQQPLTPPDPSAKNNLHWIAAGEQTIIQARQIAGMIYVSSPPADHVKDGEANSERSEDSERSERESGKKAERSTRVGRTAIDPMLPVAQHGSERGGESMPHWPSYADISPRARATYLDWLASERSDKLIGVGYVFLYFYGLERRFFVDSPSNEEKALLLAEVERLFKVYGSSRSVRRYLANFIDIAKLILQHKLSPRFEKHDVNMPYDLRAAIGRLLRDGQALSAEWLLSWYVTHPETRLSSPAKRVFPEFKALFTQLFINKFPTGLQIPNHHQPLRITYTAATGDFKTEVNIKNSAGEVPDILTLSAPLAIAETLAEQASAELDRYSRFLARNPGKRHSIEAHALLPKSLWQLFPRQEMEDLYRWAEKIITAGGLVLVDEVIERLEGDVPQGLHTSRLIDVADALARLAIGMAPDPRHALRKPKLGENVILFRMQEEIVELAEVSDNYKKILTNIALGSVVAHADGTIAATERRALQTRIDNSDLSTYERARLHANLEWMLVVPPDMTMLCKHLQTVSAETRHQFGQAILAIVAADKLIDVRELTAVEKLFQAMGLPAEDINVDLQALIATDAPTTAHQAEQKSPEHIFSPPPESNSTPSMPKDKIVLDDKKIASLRDATTQTAALLGDIFADSEPEPEQQDEETGANSLDERHRHFLAAVLQRGHWRKDELAALAAQRGLMVGGAAETLNDWSCQEHDDLLLEEDDGVYLVNEKIAAKMNGIEDNNED